jgi:hypothetical protein
MPHAETTRPEAHEAIPYYSTNSHVAHHVGLLKERYL